MKSKYMILATILACISSNESRNLVLCENETKALEQCEMSIGGKTDLGAFACDMCFQTTLAFGMQATCENFKKQDWCQDLYMCRIENCSPGCISKFTAGANCILSDCPDYQCSSGSKV